MKLSTFGCCAVVLFAITALAPISSHALLKFPALGSRRVSRDTAVASSRGYFPALSSPSGAGSASYFRKLIGFQPVYAENRAEVAAVGETGVTAGKDESSARLFGLFNPFNPFNPFANLVALPTTAQGLNLLQLKGKERIIARANLVRNGGANVLATVLFFQESALKPIVVVASGTSQAIALANARLEIRTNAIGGTLATQCSAATLGQIFSPTGATDGGVLSTTLSSTLAGANNNVFTAFINNVPATRATLFSPNSIINRSVRVTLAVDVDNSALCGTITFVA